MTSKFNRDRMNARIAKLMADKKKNRPVKIDDAHCIECGKQLSDAEYFYGSLACYHCSRLKTQR